MKRTGPRPAWLDRVPPPPTARRERRRSKIGARNSAPLLFAIALAACSATGDELVGSTEQAAQPIDRLLIGKATTYPADSTLRARTPILEANMAERRKAAWAIVEKVLMPVPIAASAPGADEAVAPAARLMLPRFQTWYSREEVLPMFDRLFRALPDSDKRARTPFTKEAIDDVFPWNATRATSLASFTEERLQARKQELATPAGLHSLGKDPRVLMSPDYVGHLLHSYKQIVDCPIAAPGPMLDAGVAGGDADGGTPLLGASPSEDFAPCLAGEFPIGAVAVKTRWMPGSAPVPVYDTSAAALGEKLARGTFGDGDAQADPDESRAYTMRLSPDTTMRLVALHIMTKELRDWAWITLWWSPDPSSDFGADRPASLTGPLANYKMCVVTAYQEKDAAPGSSFAAVQPTLAAALGAASAEGPSTWCSNPYLETAERAAKTNCIGCHQHGGTGETSDTILSAPERFPDFARTKLRESFPADYAFTTEGGLDLAAGIRARVEALTPAPQ